MPRLTRLHLPQSWKDERGRYARSENESGIEKYQGPLLQLISRQLVELVCVLSSSVMSRLEMLSEQPMSSISIKGCLGMIAPGNVAGGERPRPFKLQKLHLYSIERWSRTTTSIKQRLASWLTRRPTAVPLLRALEFNIWWGDNAQLDMLFTYFAWHGGLEVMRLSLDSEHEGAVSRVAMDNVVGAMSDNSGNTSYADHFNRRIVRANGHHNDNNADVAQRLPTHLHRRPFASLKLLFVQIAMKAAADLVSLLPNVSQLGLSIPDKDPQGPHKLFASVGAMTQLLSLSLTFEDDNTFAATHLRSLHGLRQLRYLCLRVMFHYTDLVDADMAALLTSLPHLHLLELELFSEGLTGALLSVIGKASPKLQKLLFYHPVSIGRALVPIGSSPLFPHLEVLHTDRMFFDNGEDST